MIHIRVNGEDREIAEGSTLADLVEQLSLHPRRIAIERNKQLVRRAQHAKTVLADGDVLEIVTLVGGG